MANDEHLAILNKGVEVWNAWRDENADLRPDLSGADLSYWGWANLSPANLSAADLSGANLSGANLRRADLRRADLSGANLSRANLIQANLFLANLGSANLDQASLGEAGLGLANLSEANLSHANLSRARLAGARLAGANLIQANLSGADLSEVYLGEADLYRANLSGTDLSHANLIAANLSVAKLYEANLTGARLERATLVDTDLTGADLTGSHIHGVSAWRLTLERTKQQNLVITREDEAAITVDNIEVAQFIYLILHNQNIRDVINTITSMAVLILGRFTPKRKAVLDALREELRKRNYLPILFDFEVPARGNFTETITLLARMARFIIADLTEPSSIPQELQAIVPSVHVPIQPLLLKGSPLYSMFKDFLDFPWVLPIYRYEEFELLNEPQLELALKTLAENVIALAERKVKELEKRRRMIEAELSKPQ